MPRLPFRDVHHLILVYQWKRVSKQKRVYGIVVQGLKHISKFQCTKNVEYGCIVKGLLSRRFDSKHNNIETDLPLRVHIC